jgi:CelD/BcsL family acetyltransferase involved in cellulose biosynthesis
MGVSIATTLPDGMDLQPLARAVGPFPLALFLKAWWEGLGGDRTPLIVEWETGMLPLMQDGSRLEFLGETDLTDYHSPLGADIELGVRHLVGTLSGGLKMVFDSLPKEAADPMLAAIRASGLDPAMDQHIEARVLELPASIEEFYGRVGKKERHELRRKRRRYEEQVGPIVHTTHHGPGWGFDEFLRLHRLGKGDKGRFMSGDRKRFFTTLASQPGWRVDLLEVGGSAAACLFGWTDGGDYYLYNSSYDPSLQGASPGLVLLVDMIETAIGQGWGRFDFLKGDETYKSRLGAVARPLYRIEAAT